MTAKRKTPETLGDLEFEHLHVLGPILWAIVAYTGAVALFLFHVPVLYVALIGAGVTALAPLVSVHRWFAFALMGATTGLLVWTTATTPLQPNSLYAAAGGAVLFGMTYHALRKHEPAELDTDGQAAKAAARGKYVELLEAIGAKGLTEARREPFPAGKTIILLLPVNGGVTLSALQAKTEQLDIAAARAGITATFEFERSPDSRAEVLMHVFDRDVLAETLPLEFERREKSIHDAAPLGKFATGQECSIVYRELAALLVGLKGKGKSNLINVLLAHLTACSDSVVWMLDGKGTRTVGPWIEAYLRGEVDRPAIDWPAFTDDEYHYVLLATKAVIRYRARGSGEKVNPSRSMPSVVVAVEEASVITGVSRPGGYSNVRLAQDGVVQGRSEGVDWLFASQRATVTMLGNGDMKSNLDLRIGLGVSDEHDARSIFTDGKLARALLALGDSQRYRGVFLMQAPESSRVMPVKGYRIEPEALYGMAVSNAQWAGQLDRGTADYVHAELERQGVPGGYYGRWDRIRKAMGRDAETSTPSQAETVGRTGETVTRDAETAGETYDGSRGRQAVADAVSASRAKRDTDHVDQEFAELMAASFEAVELGDDETPDTRLRDVSVVPAGVPPILRLIMAVFQGRGMPEALPTKVILADLPGTLSAKALGRLMGICNVSPVENISWEGDARARGYTRDGIETSIKRGGWPTAAFEWTP